MVLYGEPAAGEVAALLQSGECVTPCLAEVVDQLVRRNGVTPEEVVVRLDPLIEAALGVVPIENRLAWQAGEFRAVHYACQGRTCPWRLACFLPVSDQTTSSPAPIVP
jgi:hypothetical protein